MMMMMMKRKVEGEEWMREEVKKVLKEHVGDESKWSGKLKALSGQRCDWEPLYLFWRDLILKVARHLQIFIIRPSLLKTLWFARPDGLSPLSLDRVLLEMYNSGDLFSYARLPHPTAGHINRLFHTVFHFIRLSTPSPQQALVEDDYIISTLLQEKAAQVVQLLSENHWTSSCIITLTKFQDICGGVKEAYALLSHLSGRGIANYLVTTHDRDPIEGVKVSLSGKAATGTTSLDYSVLHLTWTSDKLDQRLEVISQRWNRSKESALASLKTGDKRAALRHAREMKLASQSRDKCTLLLNRVEEVLGLIADAESSKQVSEAIRIGNQAIKENMISVEDVELSIQELDKYIEVQNQVNEVLACPEIEDESIEDELKNLEVEIMETDKSGRVAVVETEGTSYSLTDLNDSLSNLHLTDGSAKKLVVESSKDRIPKEKLKGGSPEAA